MTRYLRNRQMDQETIPALAVLTDNILREIKEYGFLTVVSAVVQNVRNDMYLAAEAVRVMLKTVTAM